MKNKPYRLAYKILGDRKQKRPLDGQRKWTADCILESDQITDGRVVYGTHLSHAQAIQT